jgi:hypothetical protein
MIGNSEKGASVSTCVASSRLWNPLFSLGGDLAGRFEERAGDFENG